MRETETDREKDGDRQTDRQRDVRCSWESRGHWQQTLCHTQTAASCTALCRGRHRHLGPETGH